MVPFPPPIKHALSNRGIGSYVGSVNQLILLDQRSPIGGAPLYYCEETETTMADARALSAAAAPDGSAVVTGYQLAGRGRRSGRTWFSPPGESLMFTLIRRSVAAPELHSLRMAAAVASLLEDRWGLAAQIKWPNDVLVDGRKLCGVLADYSDSVLTIGTGLNLLQQSFPDAIAESATSVWLSCGGCKVLPARPRPTALAELLQALLECYGRLADRWHSVLTTRLLGQGEQIQVTLPDGNELIGTLEGVHRDGSLMVRKEKLYLLAAGEVSLS